MSGTNLLGNLNGRQEVFPVLDEGRLVGIITLEEITRSSPLTLVCWKEVNAANLMRPPVALNQDDDLHRALEMMLSHGLRQLPVVDDAGKLVGLLAETSIAHACVRNRHRALSDRPVPI